MRGPAAVAAAPALHHLISGTQIMWKIAVGFVAFAAIALFVISKSGNVDMGGEKHTVDHAEPAASAASAAPVSASAATPAAAASAAASK
jgi:hypothetical protein